MKMQDTYFDDESAEVVISSLRLGDDQGRWVSFHMSKLKLYEEIMLNALSSFLCPNSIAACP